MQVYSICLNINLQLSEQLRQSIPVAKIKVLCAYKNAHYLFKASTTNLTLTWIQLLMEKKAKCPVLRVHVSGTDGWSRYTDTSNQLYPSTPSHKNDDSIHMNNENGMLIYEQI